MAVKFTKLAQMMFAVCALSITAVAAADAEVCIEREALIADLDEDYGERETIRALSSGGEMLQMFVSPSGSWTMVVSTLKNPTAPCLVAAGSSFKVIVPPKSTE